MILAGSYKHFPIDHRSKMSEIKTSQPCEAESKARRMNTMTGAPEKRELSLGSENGLAETPLMQHECPPVTSCDLDCILSY